MSNMILHALSPSIINCAYRSTDILHRLPLISIFKDDGAWQFGVLWSASAANDMMGPANALLAYIMPPSITGLPSFLCKIHCCTP